jgi:hypothetical protein
MSRGTDTGGIRSTPGAWIVCKEKPPAANATPAENFYVRVPF